MKFGISNIKDNIKTKFFFVIFEIGSTGTDKNEKPFPESFHTTKYDACIL